MWHRGRARTPATVQPCQREARAWRVCRAHSLQKIVRGPAEREQRGAPPPNICAITAFGVRARQSRAIPAAKRYSRRTERLDLYYAEILRRGGLDSSPPVRGSERPSTIHRR